MANRISLCVVLGLLVTSLGCGDIGPTSTAPTLVPKKLVTPAVVGLPLSPTASQGKGGSKVELKKTDDGWQLLRNGEPYYVNGSGGAEAEGPIKMLAELGGNSTRTWGADGDSKKILDEAHKHGLSVAMGIWLGHERHGFDYSDYSQVVKQIDETLENVKRLKDHPGLLVWGVGNEMEGPKGTNPAVWSHIEHLAQLIKAEDPNHPVMTVIAEIGGKKVEAIHKLCPSVDIIGINSYGGGPSLPTRYKQVGGTKPYIVTEFGPVGTWEVGKNGFGAIVEGTSAEKAEQYQKSFAAFKADKENCLGAYAFLWGDKQEGTATWFGMLTPSGQKTAAVDTMSEFWTGKKPDNLCPVINSLTIEGGDNVKANSVVKLKLDAKDPEGKPLNVTWKFTAEAESYETGGDFQAAPTAYENSIIKSDDTSIEIKCPEDDGIYRVYAFVDDGENGAATANVPIKVNGKLKLEGNVAKGEIPFTVAGESSSGSPFVPSGFMGAADKIKVIEDCTDNPKSGEDCVKCVYDFNEHWGGVVWQSPENDWGDQPGGIDVTGAKKFTFWVRSDNGGEKVKFGFGLLGKDKKYFDTGSGEKEITLTKEWKQYSLDVENANLQRIKTGFYWSLAGQGKPITFYVDDVKFE